MVGHNPGYNQLRVWWKPGSGSGSRNFFIRNFTTEIVAVVNDPHPESGNSPKICRLADLRLLRVLLASVVQILIAAAGQGCRGCKLILYHLTTV